MKKLLAVASLIALSALSGSARQGEGKVHVTVINQIDASDKVSSAVELAFEKRLATEVDMDVYKEGDTVKPGLVVELLSRSVDSKTSFIVVETMYKAIGIDVPVRIALASADITAEGADDEAQGIDQFCVESWQQAVANEVDAYTPGKVVGTN